MHSDSEALAMRDSKRRERQDGKVCSLYMYAICNGGSVTESIINYANVKENAVSEYFLLCN